MDLMTVDGPSLTGLPEVAGIAVMLLTLGCAPVSLLGLALAFAARRRPESSGRWNGLYFAAFVFNVCGLVVSTLLLSVLALDVWGNDVVSVMLGVFVLLHVVCGVFGARAWLTLRSAVPPERPKHFA